MTLTLESYSRLEELPTPKPRPLSLNMAMLGRLIDQIYPNFAGIGIFDGVR